MIFLCIFLDLHFLVKSTWLWDSKMRRQGYEVSNSMLGFLPSMFFTCEDQIILGEKHMISFLEFNLPHKLQRVGLPLSSFMLDPSGLSTWNIVLEGTVNFNSLLALQVSEKLLFG